MWPNKKPEKFFSSANLNIKLDFSFSEDVCCTHTSYSLMMFLFIFLLQGTLWELSIYSLVAVGHESPRANMDVLGWYAC